MSRNLNAFIFRTPSLGRLPTMPRSRAWLSIGTPQAPWTASATPRKRASQTRPNAAGSPGLVSHPTSRSSAAEVGARARLKVEAGNAPGDCLRGLATLDRQPSHPPFFWFTGPVVHIRIVARFTSSVATPRWSRRSKKAADDDKGAFNATVPSDPLMRRWHSTRLTVGHAPSPPLCARSISSGRCRSSPR
jgi:hypothetical protein